MPVDSVLGQNQLDLSAPKKFTSKAYYGSIFIAFLFGVILTLAYRPDFGSLAYEVSVRDYETAQTMCSENNGLGSVSVSSYRTKYHVTALCKDGVEKSW